MYVLHPHAQQAALPSHLVHRQCHAHVQSWGLPLPNAAQHFFFYHPGRQRVVSSHCLLFSDRLPPAPQLSQKLAFQLSLPLLEERRRANTACSLIFVCLSVRASVCARHMEVNTSNLALKECSVFRSRPSLFRRPTTTDVHLGNSAAEVQGGGDTAFFGDPRSRWRRNQLLLKMSEKPWSRSGFARWTWFVLCVYD